MPFNSQEEFLRIMEQGISRDRLTSYRRNARSLSEGMAYYAWNTALCESLYTSLNAFEIALRNRLHRVLSTKAGGDQWYTERAGILRETELTQIREIERALTAARKPVNAPAIIGELHFGFWASLFDRRYERVLWPQSGRQTFPYAPMTELPRERLSRRVERIRRLRNRVFHFEPLWHWENLTDHHAFVLESTGHINPAIKEYAILFDHFPAVYAGGVTPYEKRLTAFLDGIDAKRGATEGDH